MGKNQDLNILNYALMKKTTDALDRKLDDAIVGIYTPGGSYTFENLPALSADTLGKVYVVTDDFTTTSDFVEGAGVDYPAGTNVAVVNRGTDADPVYKYDATTGAIVVDDSLSLQSENPVQNKVITAALNAKQPKTLSAPIVVDGVTYTTVETVLTALALKKDAEFVQALPTASSDTMDTLYVVEASGIDPALYISTNNNGTYSWFKLSGSDVEEITSQQAQADWQDVFGNEGIPQSNTVSVTPTIFDSSDVTIVDP